MKTPEDKAITFTFGSHPAKDPKMRWEAKLSFPPGATADTMLTLTVVDGEDTPVGGGLFEFAGMKIRISDGSAQISYRDFIKGKNETALWLHRKGMLPVPGGLTFR